MFIPPFFAAAYAETHYKFKLPWSPLHEPWPEIFLDAPCRVEPHKHWPVWLVLRDADLYPTRIHSVHLTISANGFAPIELDLPIELTCEGAFHFIPLDVPLQGRKGTVRVHAQIHAERIGTKILAKSIKDWNYPGLAPQPLQVLVLEHPFPKPNGWWAGETHCHTWHSSDPVEFGAPAQVFQQSAQALGLDYVLCTDHSYDFCFRQDNYRIPMDPQLRWANLQQEFAELPPYPLMVPGEEVSCGNADGKNVHLLVAGHPEYIPGLGDSGRRWLQNQPDLTVGEVLARASAVPCFAAHPQYPMGWLERKIFRRGPYSAADLQLAGPNPIAGLEFWNGSLDKGYQIGRAFWIQQLLAGHSILPIGGNDAHGDLNRFTGVRVPLVSLRSSRSRIFGRVRTVLEGCPEDSLRISTLHGQFRKAQNSAKLYCTDGPALELNQQGSTMHIHAFSSPDFGPIDELRIYCGQVGAALETCIISRPGKLDIETPYSIPAHSTYVRAECKTRLGYHALSAAKQVI